MKYASIFLLFFLISCSADFDFSVTNNSDETRKNELVSFDLSKIDKNITDNNISVISEGKALESQIVTEGNDVKIYFLDSFKCCETKQIQSCS
ncbi:MAG: DUF4861 family protein [Saprospiraceae bacterium]